MKKSIRILPAALALAFAAALPVAAQTQPAQPGTVEKAENAGEKAWDATKSGTRKAVDATESGAKKAWKSTKTTSKKAWNATKRGTRKAVDTTENAAGKAGSAVSNTASAAADKTRQVGDKIGEKIPGTPQNEAAKKP